MTSWFSLSAGDTILIELCSLSIKLNITQYQLSSTVKTSDTRRVCRVEIVGFEWLGTGGTSGPSTPAGGWTGTVPTSTQVS